MKIDLHVHTRERSPCGRSGETEMIESAIEHGMNGLFFTEHNQFVPRDRIVELNNLYRPFRIFSGIEVSLGNEHALVYGLDDAVLERPDYWTYLDLRGFVKAGGGLMILAHPYRYQPVGAEIEAHPPDAVEYRSTNIKPENVATILEFSEKTGCRKVCASDAHHRDMVGNYYVDLERMAGNVGDVIAQLLAGRYVCGERTASPA